MNVTLKKISEQVILITGASSGIGLVTARVAVGLGAKVMLVARNDAAIKKAAEDFGENAAYFCADVSKFEDLENAARACIDRFGRIDTWVNNAGVSIYGKETDVPLDEQRKLFETNFWGVVYGSLIAAKELRKAGGALINMGSITSDRAFPLQAMYSASKHAVKGFTDGLRMELEEEDAPISVTLIKPASINTPFTEHAKNYLEKEPTPPPPVYAPEVVADAILYAAQTPIRDLLVGGAGKMLSASASAAPRLLDKIMEAFFFSGQKSAEPAHIDGNKGLDSPGEGLKERGPYRGRTLESSMYTKAAEHPFVSGLMLTGAFLGISKLISRVSSTGHR